MLERALDVRTADEQVAVAQADVDKDAALRARLDMATAEREALAARRAAMTVPAPAALVPMRRLATDLAAARGALNVGLVVTVTPTPSARSAGAEGRVARRIRRRPRQPMEIEANAEVDIDIADVATVRVRGGRREAQKTAEVARGALEARGGPASCRRQRQRSRRPRARRSRKLDELDASIKAKDAELESLRGQIAVAGRCGADAARGHRARRQRAAPRSETMPLETLADRARRAWR